MIAVLWKPAAFEPKPFKVSHFYFELLFAMTLSRVGRI